MSYLLTYKLSQDHLETFFSAIRSRCGYNDNPTCYQFQTAYKRLLVHNQIRSSMYANCQALDKTLKTPSAVEIINEDNQLNHNITNIDNAKLTNSNDFTVDEINLNTLSLYVDDVCCSYIAGFVV